MKKIKYIIVLIVCMIVGMGEACAFSCGYTIDTSSKSYSTNLDYIGFSDYAITFNSSSDYSATYGTLTMNKYGYVGNLKVSYGYFDSSDFYDYYNSYGTCPGTIYMCYDSTYLYVAYPTQSSLTSVATCQSYKTTSEASSSSAQSSDGKNCTLSSSSSCTHATVTDYDGDKAYVEIGTTSSGSKYLLVSYNSDFSSYKVSYNGSSSFNISVQVYKNSSDSVVFYTDDESIWQNNGTYSSLASDMVRNGTSYDIYIRNTSTESNQYADEEEELTTNEGITSSTSGEVLGAVKYEYNSGSVCSVYVCDTKGNCDANGVLKAMQLIGYVIYIMKILVPIILIIMGMVDLTRGVIANDNKASSEVIMAFVRRIAVAVIIFLIPSILSFLLDLVYGVQETMTDSSAQIENCTNCLLHPLDSDTCLAEDFIQE